MKGIHPLVLVFATLLALVQLPSFAPPQLHSGPQPQDAPTATLELPPPATPAELIALTNQLRAANGLTLLTENSILMATAQGTADYMAANAMIGHIGGVADRIMAAGYGNGQTAWATENIAVGIGFTAEEIVFYGWSDDTHSIPAKNPIYCDIGAGVATDSEGQVYYVVHAAYHNKRTCGPYIHPDGSLLPWAYTATAEALAGGQTGGAPPQPQTALEQTQAAQGVPQWIIPVRTVTPGPEGETVHQVLSGQSLWSIAIAYRVKIKDILSFNNLAQDWETIYAGQKLRIPTSLTPLPISTPGPSATPPAATGQAVALALSTPTAAATPADARATATLAPPNPADARSRTVQTIILVAGGAGLGLMLFGLLAGRKRG